MSTEIDSAEVFNAFQGQLQVMGKLIQKERERVAKLQSDLSKSELERAKLGAVAARVPDLERQLDVALTRLKNLEVIPDPSLG